MVRWPRALQAAHAVFYTTVVTLPFLVTGVFWGVLFRGPWFGVVEVGWANVGCFLFLSLFGFWVYFVRKGGGCLC